MDQTVARPRVALVGLSEGFRVRHIACFNLVTCRPEDNHQEIFARPDLADFDQIPVKRGNNIIGVLERGATEPLRQLDDSILVSSEER